MTQQRTTPLLFAVALLLIAFWLRVSDLVIAPPGLHFDEAANAIITQNIALGDYRPIFIPDFTGKEVLWFYLTALLTRFAGGDVFVVRYSSVLIGLLTVAVSGWAVKRLYADDKNRSWLALLTMAVIGVALWHSILSRLAFRAVTQPLLQAITLGLLWTAFRTTDNRRGLIYAAAAGAVFGLTGYTYLAARLFPLVVAVGLLVWLIARRFDLLSLLRTLVFSIAAVSSFAPLGVYFLQNPEAFSTRIEQVGPTSIGDALEGWRLAGRMLFLSGDPLWRFNLPLAPLFDPVLGIMLIVGFSVVIWRTFSVGLSAQDRARQVVLVIWPIVMLAPTALAVESITPSNLRAVGLLPLIALFPALGLMQVASWLTNNDTTKSEAVYWAAMALTLVGGGLFTTFRLDEWQTNAELYLQSDAHVAALAQEISTYDQDAIIFAATEHLDHPTVRYMAQPNQPGSIFRGEAAVFSNQGETVLAYVRNATPPEAWQIDWAEYLTQERVGPDAALDYVIYEMPLGYLPEMDIESQQNVANVLLLHGATVHPAISGTQAEIDLLFEITGIPAQPDYAFTAQLCDIGEWCWLKANADGTVERGVNASFPSDRWQIGDHLLVRLAVPLPYGVPPGDYHPQVSIFSASGGQALPVIDGAGRVTAQQIALPPVVEIDPNPSPEADEVPIQFRERQQVSSSVDLLGWDLPIDTALQGEVINLALHWLATDVNAQSEEVTLRLGDQVILRRNPVYDTYSTDNWTEGELITDRYSLTIPVDFPAGPAEMSIQLGEAGQPIRVGNINIQQVDRRFEVPADLTALDEPVIFDEQIELLGFIDLPDDLVVIAGETISLAPIWRGRMLTLTTDYTIFIHLLDEMDQLIAQVDRVPQVDEQSYPTSLWVANEVIVEDPYALTLPPDLAAGRYQLIIGMYLPETGQRLLLEEPDADSYQLPLDVHVE